jgi:hypothetical protein
MKLGTIRTLFALTSLVAVSAGIGCVQDRPSRNGVFNENQYIRKDFLVPSNLGNDAMGNPLPDPGWQMRATVTEVSSPNLLGGGLFFVYAGLVNGGDLVRFAVTQDKLQLLSMREVEPSQSISRTPEIVNAWPITNVDLKYRVNLDGEKTNFYEENQELDWQVRQWVKVNFAKNDLSDVAPFGPYLQDSLAKCADLADASATLKTGSFVVDEPNNYMQWTVQVTVPMKFDDATCVDNYGTMYRDAAALGRYNETFDIMYSMARANPTPTYQPLIVDEKDPILHKYGPILYRTIAWDDSSQLLASTQYVQRFDPTKDIVWYFDQGFPENYKHVFTDANTGVGDKTNALLQAAGAKKADGTPPKVSFLNWNDATTLGDAAGPVRQFGDIRYSFLRWDSDKDMQDQFGAATDFIMDRRTGETLASEVVFNDEALKDYVTQRLDAYLVSVGASQGINSAMPWPTGTCTIGDTQPITAAAVTNVKNASDSLYGKMQQYLHKPIAQYGNLGPADFIQPQDDDFRRAYYALIPYIIYADPDSNFYVQREGGAGLLGPANVDKLADQEAVFHQMAADIDHGKAPFVYDGPAELQNALAFANQMKTLTTNHRNLGFAEQYAHSAMGIHMDPPPSLSFEAIVQKDSQQCVADPNNPGKGTWQTKEQWQQATVDTYWNQVFWHEFGHTMGLEHNFAGNIDMPNYPAPVKDSKGVSHYPMYSSSVMEYNAIADNVFYTGGWAPHDSASIEWIYANNGKVKGAANMQSLYGQTSPTMPWNDPGGFQTVNGMQQETGFIYCGPQHVKYTPLCREGDMGSTPSEIIANDIENYEWEYAWRNYRVYHKFWDNSAYANYPAGFIHDLKRFLSMWAFDWNSGELATTFHRIGILPPGTDPSVQHYYDQLGLKFTQEVSAANQMVAAFHKAVINQSTGERPILSVYDPYYGDETQQGIILDKFFATEEWVGLWPADNYDQNQAGATYLSSFADFGEPAYNAVAVDAAESMIGTQYDVVPWFIPNAVATFAQDTHDPAFAVISGQQTQLRDLIGGYSFYRQADFEAFFKKIAVQHNFDATCNASNPKNQPDPIAACDYDVTNAAITGADPWQQFTAPDGLRWIWTYIIDRNAWMAARLDRNVATFKIIHNYNDDINVQLDDGTFGAYGFELPIKYTLDSFNAFN